MQHISTGKKPLAGETILRTLGKRFDNKKLSTMSRIFRNEVTYSSSMDDVDIKKLVPEGTEVLFSRREMKTIVGVRR